MISSFGRSGHSRTRCPGSPQISHSVRPGNGALFGHCPASCPYSPHFLQRKGMRTRPRFGQEPPRPWPGCPQIGQGLFVLFTKPSSGQKRELWPWSPQWLQCITRSRIERKVRFKWQFKRFVFRINFRTRKAQGKESPSSLV